MTKDSSLTIAPFHLLVFLKTPEPGKVKTRLAASVGNEEACDIYRHLVDVTLKAILGFDSVTLCYTPDESGVFWETTLRKGWSCLPQGSGDLGIRIARMIQTVFDSKKTPIIVIGTDCPEIRPQDILDAAHDLSSVDAVIGPAQDGGYWLIGLQKPCPELFKNIDWGTASVLAQTLEIANHLGLKTRQLRELMDIDDLQSWNLYQRQTRNKEDQE